MKKNLIAIILISTLAIFAIFYIYTAFNGKRDTKNPNDSSHSNGNLEVKEPKFRHDGDLYVLNSQGNDTLGQFNIEIVEDEYSITTGLMYRKQMDENRGMLFLFPDERPRSFWMKNTHIPLDIIFIAGNGSIVTIARNTKPFSTQSVPSTGPAKYVLEVNAGIAQKFKWKEGDVIVWNKR